MSTSTPLHPGWAIQLAVHRAVRRDLARLAGAVEQGGASPGAVGAYWNDFAGSLHHHHELEDTLMWPCLAERIGPRVDAPLVRNGDEHRSMSAAMDRFAATLPGLHADVDAARVALASAADVILTHLDHEEAEVLPLIPEAFTGDDVDLFRAAAAKMDPPEHFLPWLLDDAAEEVVAALTADLPAPVASALDSTWLPARRMRLDAVSLTGRYGAVEALEDAYAAAGQVVRDLSADELDRASTCPGWDVCTTLNHLLGTVRMFTLANRGQLVGEDAGDLVGADPQAALQEQAESSLAEWRMPAAFAGERSLPFGTFPAAATALMNLSEVVVHTWDIATAIGRPFVVDPGAAEMVLDFYRAIPLDGYRAHGAFGHEVDVPADAPAFDRLLALLGRRPA